MIMWAKRLLLNSNSMTQTSRKQAVEDKTRPPTYLHSSNPRDDQNEGEGDDPECKQKSDLE